MKAIKYLAQKTWRDSYLHQVGHSQVHHEHNRLLGFSDISPEYPERQHVTQQTWCQDHTVHHCIHIVLVCAEICTVFTAVVGKAHLKPRAVYCLVNQQEACIRKAACCLVMKVFERPCCPLWRGGVHASFGEKVCPALIHC